MSVPIQTWCWYCKQNVPPDAGTCPSCGKPLSDAKRVVKCARCGKFLLKAAGRCGQCGTPLPSPFAQPAPIGQAPGASFGQPQQPAQPSQGQPMPFMPPVLDAESPVQPDADAPQDASAQTAFPSQSSLSAEERRAALETLEQLEAMGSMDAHMRQSSGKSGSKGGIVRILVIVLTLLLIGAGVYLGIFHRGSGDSEPEPAAACADGNHQWTEADCTHPRTCSVCGATEGEPLGHNYVGNVCDVCGAYRKPFFFSDPACERDGSTVIFWGNVQNCSGTGVQYLQIQLDLYDKDMNPVTTELAYAVEGETLPMLGTTRWEIHYDDSALTWKYWRISAINYTAVEP